MHDRAAPSLRPSAQSAMPAASASSRTVGSSFARRRRPCACRPRGRRSSRSMGSRWSHGGRRRCSPAAHPDADRDSGAGIAMCFFREGWLRHLSRMRAAPRVWSRPAGGPCPRARAALGVTALASMPRVEQLLLAPSRTRSDRRAYRARRRAEPVAGVYVASLSFLTVTYKALCAASQLARFYPDLEDPELAVPFAIFHQRFSTNTEPSWERAQPFRLLCHNGEINTIDGNVAWMEARERALGVEPELAPSLDPAGSDSALLDNALELLVRGHELDLAQAVSLSFPPPGRTIRASNPRFVTFIGTGRFSASLGTGRPPCASRTAASPAPRSTGTAFARCGSRSPATDLSPSPPRLAPFRFPRREQR